MPDWSEQEHAFARALQREMGQEEKGMPAQIGKLQKPPAVFTGGASSDHGDVTLVAPTATIGFPGCAERRARAPLVRRGVWFRLDRLERSSMRRKAMAASAIDLLTDAGALEKIRREFEDYAKTHPYKSFLPPDAKPPLDINEKLMNQYRPLDGGVLHNALTSRTELGDRNLPGSH